ncbi:MAG: PorT family protein [Cytophagales bacterium]|nr:MAG: PorT family protein [Cytophagales bacterium]
MKNILLLGIFSLLFWGNIHAQNFPFDTAQSNNKSIYDKKILIGLQFNQSFTSLNIGEQPRAYFFKPSIGIGLRLNYYFAKKWGLAIGIDYQQRGTGVKNPDFEGGLGNPDSTNRERLRFNCLEIPIHLLYRSASPIFKNQNMRWSLFVGIAPSYNLQASDVFHSIEDGFHQVVYVTDLYARFDAIAQMGIGLEFQAGYGTLFQLHLIGNLGLLNVYNSEITFGKYSARNSAFGLRLGFMF